MKNFMQLTMLIPMFLVAACGVSKNSKDPVADLDDIRVKAKLETQTGPRVPEKQIEYVPQPVEVTREQKTLTADFVKITIDPIVTFYEGQKSSYKVTLSVMEPGFTMKLTAEGLPKGDKKEDSAEFVDISTPKEPNTYELRWKPAYGLLKNDAEKLMSITLVPTIYTAKDTKKADLVRGMNLKKVVPFFLKKSQEKPSELAISGLPAEVQEGQVVPFTVVATFPGLDQNAGQEPYISRTEDPNAATLPTDVLEMDGTRYVKLAGATKYLGNFKWEFNLVFNTKTIPVEDQLTKGGKPAGTNSTQTRFILRAYGVGNATNEKIVRVKINRAVVEAPAPAAEGGGK